MPDAAWWAKVAADRPGGKMAEELQPLTEDDLDEIDGDFRYDEHHDKPDLWAQRAHRLVAEVRRLRQRMLQIEVTTFGNARKEILCNACGKTYDGGPLDGWVTLAAAEIAGDPSARIDATRIADVIRGHLESAAKKRGT